MKKFIVEYVYNYSHRVFRAIFETTYDAKLFTDALKKDHDGKVAIKYKEVDE